MLHWDADQSRLVGAHGDLSVLPDDEVTRKLLMLIEGECLGLGGTAAAAKHGYCKQRYFQLLHAFRQRGAEGLRNGKRGPKGPSRRTEEAVRQIIRHRYLDPDVTVEVIAQKLQQCRFSISARSVRRVIENLGLQKKTLRQSSRRHAGSH
jgi:transposase